MKSLFFFALFYKVREKKLLFIRPLSLKQKIGKYGLRFYLFYREKC